MQSVASNDNSIYISCNVRFDLFHRGFPNDDLYQFQFYSHASFTSVTSSGKDLPCICTLPHSLLVSEIKSVTDGHCDRALGSGSQCNVSNR